MEDNFNFGWNSIQEPHLLFKEKNTYKNKCKKYTISTLTNKK